MADGARYDFGMQRNEDYQRAWVFCDPDENIFDITAWSATLRINSAAGLQGAPLLSIGQTPTTKGSRITLNGPDGLADVLIKKEDIASLPGRTADIVPFSYNLIVVDGGGTRRADVRGLFIVEPGV